MESHLHLLLHLLQLLFHGAYVERLLSLSDELHVWHLAVLGAFENSVHLLQRSAFGFDPPVCLNTNNGQFWSKSGSVSGCGDDLR